MKKSFGISLSLVVLFFQACTIEQKSQSWQEVEYSQEGNITLKYVASDGFAYYDENDSLTGVTTEIFRDFVAWVKDEYDVDLETNYVAYESWSDFYNAVKNDRSGTFGMGNVTITEKRWEELYFSPAYMTNIAVLITHEETPELTAMSQMNDHFAHLNALAFEGTLHETRLKHFREVHYPDLEIDYAYSNNEIIDKTAEENVYFAYVDVYNYWRVKESGKPLRRHPAGDNPSEQFGFIMPYNADWEPIMYRFFHKEDGYLNSDRYREIMETHLGQELAEMLENARLQPNN